MNMFALLSLGLLAERLYGSTRFALIYLLAAVAGNVASGWWDRTSNSAGASGAIFGVFGALLVFAWRRSADLPLEVPGRARSAALLFLVYSLVIGYLLPSTVSVAHAGGLLGGTLAGLLLIRPFEPAARSVPQPWRVLAVGAGLFALLVALSVPLLARSGMR
jgi:rhomboid protease GluP